VHHCFSGFHILKISFLYIWPFLLFAAETLVWGNLLQR
jgi:hypothetical protein